MSLFKPHSTLLIIGPVPPPIGGVSVHVSRLSHLLRDHLSIKHVKIRYCLPSLLQCLIFRRFHVVHLHSSSPFLRLLVSAIPRLFQVKLVCTYHGDLGRFRPFINLIDILSVALCHTPIVLNSDSLTIAKCFNHSARFLSAYIPPIDSDKLSPEHTMILNEARQSYKFLVSTNAYNVTFTPYGFEIYGIVDLLKLFSGLSEHALIISDPSSRYYPYVLNVIGTIPPNVYFLTGEHDFVSVLPMVDIFVRNTLTDGDSLSIHEALSAGLLVFATDVVSRPSCVVVYKTLSTLKDMLLSVSPRSDRFIRSEVNETFAIQPYLSLYDSQRQ